MVSSCLSFCIALFTDWREERGEALIKQRSEIRLMPKQSLMVLTTAILSGREILGENLFGTVKTIGIKSYLNQPVEHSGVECFRESVPGVCGLLHV